MTSPPLGQQLSEAVFAVADEDGEWFSYTFPNPATGGVETKHSWIRSDFRIRLIRAGAKQSRQSHHNPMFIDRDPSLRVDATGHFPMYGDDLLSATESGKWVDYVLLNPETGDDRQKHTWAVLHDGLIFASGWYE